jgi:hypothetical protein
MTIWEMQQFYRDEWVVLDRCLRVIDKAASLRDLRSRHGDRDGRCTYYFVPAA